MWVWPVEHNDGDNVPQQPQAPHRGDQHLLQEDLRPLHIRGTPGHTLLLTGIHLFAVTILFSLSSQTRWDWHWAKNAHLFYFRDDKNFTDCYQSYDPHLGSIKHNSWDYFIHYIGGTAGSMDYHNLAGGHNICWQVCAGELHEPADCSLMSGCTLKMLNVRNM